MTNRLRTIDGRTTALRGRDNFNQTSRTENRFAYRQTEYLRFRQEDGSIPADASDWPPIILWNRTFRIYGVLCHWEDFDNQTFTMQVKIDGTLQSGTQFSGTDFDDDDLKPFFFDNGVDYTDNKEITLNVSASDSLAEFEAILLMQRLL